MLLLAVEPKQLPVVLEALEALCCNSIMAKPFAADKARACKVSKTVKSKSIGSSGQCVWAQDDVAQNATEGKAWGRTKGLDKISETNETISDAAYELAS